MNKREGEGGVDQGKICFLFVHFHCFWPFVQEKAFICLVQRPKEGLLSITKIIFPPRGRGAKTYPIFLPKITRGKCFSTHPYYLKIQLKRVGQHIQNSKRNKNEKKAQFYFINEAPKYNNYLCLVGL